MQLWAWEYFYWSVWVTRWTALTISVANTSLPLAVWTQSRCHRLHCCIWFSSSKMISRIDSSLVYMFCRICRVLVAIGRCTRQNTCFLPFWEMRDHTGVNRHAASRPVDSSCTKYRKIWTMSKFRRSSENHMMLSHNMCNCYITQLHVFPYQDGRLEEPSAGRTGKESGFYHVNANEVQ